VHVLLPQPILIIEDNLRISAHVANILATAGYASHQGPDAHQFWEQSRKRRHAVYVLDIGLPDADGTELIHEIRQSGDRTPILVLSAKAELDTKLLGLANGADDYLTKPFHPRELVARIHALIRRAHSTSEPSTIEFGRLSFDTASNEAHVDNKPLRLKRAESAALGYLLRFARRTVAREALRAAVYRDARISENAIDKTISRLRQALIDADCGVEIVTLKGTGYMLTESGDE
jgi:two-component system, OmpR family, response regulator